MRALTIMCVIVFTSLCYSEDERHYIDSGVYPENANYQFFDGGSPYLYLEIRGEEAIKIMNVLPDSTYIDGGCFGKMKSTNVIGCWKSDDAEVTCHLAIHLLTGETSFMHIC